MPCTTSQDARSFWHHQYWQKGHFRHIPDVNETRSILQKCQQWKPGNTTSTPPLPYQAGTLQSPDLSSYLGASPIGNLFKKKKKMVHKWCCTPGRLARIFPDHSTLCLRKHGFVLTIAHVRWSCPLDRLLELRFNFDIHDHKKCNHSGSQN